MSRIVFRRIPKSEGPTDFSHGSCRASGKPRVAIVLPSLLPFGGTERVRMAMAEEMIGAGCDVDILLAWEPNDVRGSVPEDARVLILGVSRLRNFIRPFVRYLRHTKPDAILSAMWPLTSFSLLAHRLSRSCARIVVSDHNVLSAQYARRGAAHRLALRASLALTYPLAHARVAVSSGVADDVAALSGMSADRFVVIHNPMPLAVVNNTKAKAVEAAWGGWTGPRILTVGHLKAQKNHALLIRAFRRVLETTRARLMILGTGELEDETKAVARSEGIADKVLFPGQAADPLPYYRSTDLFVLSSDYEGFGNVIVEALACGIPVVSTDCPSGPGEILESGRYGRLTPVGDACALAAGIVDALAADQDTEALKRRAAEFSPQAVAGEYLKLLLPLGVRRREATERGQIV